MDPAVRPTAKLSEGHSAMVRGNDSLAAAKDINLRVEILGAMPVMDVDPGNLPHGFDRFYRADPARSRGAGGSGLRLAITQAVVAEDGGKITASSDGLNQDSTLVICLPKTR